VPYQKLAFKLGHLQLPLYEKKKEKLQKTHKKKTQLSTISRCQAPKKPLTEKKKKNKQKREKKSFVT